MKRFAIFILLLVAAYSASAQVVVSNNKSTYDWPTAVSDVGQLGSYIDLTPMALIPINYTIDWTASGTAPSACTFRVEGSADHVTWFGLDATAPAADSVPCTSSNMISIAQKPVRYLRVYLVTYTAGDGTTSVKFHYTAGR